MQTIEINTSQNVKIEYQLAGVGHRLFAFIIDFIIITIVYILLYILFFDNGESKGEVSTLLFQLLLFFWISFYTLFSEFLGNGQTIGKLAMGIKVIKLNGEELEFYDYFSRWSMRIIDIYFSIGTIAMLLIVSNKNGQRLGDIIAGTTIIRVKSAYGFRLKDILKLNLKDKESYEFQYPLARNLEEKDVILIKHLIYRNRLYNNKAHEKAMEILVQKLARILEVEKVPKDREMFLNKVISEYIILTR